MACILLWSSGVRVHDSKAYRKMDVTREHISHILELREILLSIQTGFSLVNAAVACAVLESISGLEPSSVITEPRYLKLVTVTSFCPFTLISVLIHWCCLSSAWSSQHWSPCCRLWRLCQDIQLNLPVLLPLLLNHQCHQQSGGWWLFYLQCWQCLCDLLRRLSWSFPEICWRGWVRVDIPVGLQLLFRTSLLCYSWRGRH